MDEDIALGIAQLGLWSGSIAELERLAVPSPETVKRFENELARLAAERERLSREQEAGKARLETARAESRALEIGGVVPTEMDLLAARAASRS